jgi:uncharacterized membrane protein YpjA
MEAYAFFCCEKACLFAVAFPVVQLMNKKSFPS